MAIQNSYAIDFWLILYVIETISFLFLGQSEGRIGNRIGLERTLEQGTPSN